MIYFGIDPGVRGGIARISCVNGKLKAVELWSFTDHTLHDLVGLFSSLFQHTFYREILVTLERVHALPSTFRGCSTSWTLAENFSAIKTLLTMHEIPFELVLPEKWQTVMGVRIKKTEKKVDKKKINREKAQALFPKLAGITKDTADALLIAEYNRRTHK